MSKQDSQFFNIFSLVLGILIVIALILFAFARVVGNNTQKTHLLSDPKYVGGVAANLTQARVAVAGQDNSALTIRPSVGAMVTETDTPTDGIGVYEVVCAACHGAGIAGAPKVGDRGAWSSRIAKGTATLYKNSIEGYTGSAGVMPAKGGRVDLSDELIQAAVDYMVAESR